MINTLTLQQEDSAVWDAIQAEKNRQEDHVELIASENYVSRAVLEAQGSVLTNKYAEGYPGARYYGGCEYVDVVESLAIERAKQLFGADYVNVQPHSGSAANVAAYAAMIEPGSTVLGMNLAHGGHLTHGAPVSFSGKLYRFFSYGIDLKTGLIDYDAIKQLAEQHRPRLIVSGFSSYSRVVDWQQLRKIADSVGAFLMADIAHVAGLVATGLYPSPVNIADVTTTTTHKTLRGPRGGLILAKPNAALHKKLNSAIFPGNQGGPLMHVIAAKAVAFQEALHPSFKQYQQQILNNARCMAETVISRGYKVVSGGTDNHMFLIDLVDKKITGKAAEIALDRAFITTNKNAVPNDPESPFITSGIRLGTPAVTTRGLKEKECVTLAHWVCDILDDLNNEMLIQKVQNAVRDLCRQFPVYAGHSVEMPI